MSPAVSVLLPCFNDGAWLDDAIASVEAQTFRDFEILVVDDGSTDAATVAKVAACEGPRTRTFRTANQGLPAARNHAAAHARGRYFCALDADDRLAPEWFEKAARVLAERPDVAFVSHWLETFGDERWTWRPESCELAALLARNSVNGAALVRREAFEAVGGYDVAMRHGCEDWDLWLRLAARGYAGFIIPEVLFHYRRRATSMSRTMGAGGRVPDHPLYTLVRKHQGAYREHAVDVLLARDAEMQELWAEVDGMEDDRLMVLEPALARAGEELEAILAKAERARILQEIEEDRRRLAWKAGELEREVAALRTSWSWRITGPLRRVYEWLRPAG